MDDKTLRARQNASRRASTVSLATLQRPQHRLRYTVLGNKSSAQMPTGRRGILRTDLGTLAA
jgi:hypothetical protein